MKRRFTLTLLLIFASLTGFAETESFHINSVTVLTQNPSDCQDTWVAATFALQNSSITYDSMNYFVSGNNIFVNIYTTDPGGISLPMIVNVIDSVNLGNLTAGGKTLTTTYYQNFNSLDVHVDTFSVASCCPANASFTATDTTPCIGDTVTFTGSGSGSQTYGWSVNGQNFGSGQTASYPFTSGGTFTVMLIAIDSGCTDVDSMHVTAAACCAVQADYSYAPSPPCKGDTIVFTNNSVGANQFEWQIDGNTVDTSSSYSHVFTADGNFNVSLIAGDGSCSDTFNVPMSISTPTANFSFAPDTMNSLTYNFADSSTSAATWSWDFGDGNTSTSQNGQHTYANNGNYTVCLTVANSAGCEDSTCSVFTAGPVSRGDMHSNVRLVIFPNPTSGEIQIQSNIKIDKVEVLDLTGRATGKDINDLPAGTYLLRIETELGTVTEKVVRY